MFGKLFPLIKRAVVYPAVVGYFFYFMFRESSYFAEGTNFFLVNIVKEMISFVELPDQFYYFLTFYFFGYTYGLISEFWSARKSNRGIVSKLFILGTKLGLVLWTYFLTPVFLILEVVVALGKISGMKKKPVPIQTTPESGY